MLLVSAMCACLAVLLGTSPARSRRRGPPPADAGTGRPRRIWSRGRAARRTASLLAAVATWLLVGGPAGLVLGLGVATLLPVALSVLESSRDRRLRREMVRAAPLVADLLAATLAAGVPIERAVGVIARAVGGPAGEALAGVVRRQELGEPAHTAWARLDSLPGVGAIARTVARSVAGGAPLADVLGQLARDLRVAAHAEALADVRAVSVRAVLPLGLCLLPAFVLLGVVPIVGGLLPDL